MGFIATTIGKASEGYNKFTFRRFLNAIGSEDQKTKSRARGWLSYVCSRYNGRKPGLNKGRQIDSLVRMAIV